MARSTAQRHTWRVLADSVISLPNIEHPRRRGSPLKEVDRGSGWYEEDKARQYRRARASCVSTPGSLTHEPSTGMSNFYHLHYAISKRTLPSPKVWKAIVDVQAELNRRLSWTHEGLNLAPVRQPDRGPFAFPFVQIGPPKQVQPDARILQVQAPQAARIEDAYAAGSTKVRDSLWNAHLVVAWLRHISACHPELLLELRDEGGFVLPGAVWIRGGKVELQRDWLNRERERVLEISGDPNSAAPFVWAEAEALQGRFFIDGPVSDWSEVPEVQELGLTWDEQQSLSIGDAADMVVARVATSTMSTNA